MQKAFIETQLPIARLSAETLKERNSGAGQTLTGLGKWWSRKRLIHVRAIIVGTLMPASPNLKKDREILLKSLPWMTKEHETNKRARFKLENGEMPRLWIYNRSALELAAFCVGSRMNKKNLYVQRSGKASKTRKDSF
jgi:adenine-specific DNA methylase